MSTPATLLSQHAEARFRAMGSDAHVIVVGADTGLLAHAIDRVEHFESRWSRFRDDSDVSRLNRSAGQFCDVSAETGLMIERAIDLWRMTASRVDPLVLGAVIGAGYDRTFEALGELRTRATPSRLIEPWTMIACTDIELASTGATTARVRLPHGATFDPGGIGKGLAADLIVAELLAAGADGACVNVGGDLRVGGRAPHEGGWTVAIDHPWSEESVLTVRVGDGAVATSSVLRRVWTVDGSRRHHLIDPTTGQPSTTDLVQASVVAGQAWVAEGLAKAILLAGSSHPFDLLPDGIEAVAVHRDGTVLLTDGLRRFVVEDVVPTHLDHNDQDHDLTMEATS